MVFFYKGERNAVRSYLSMSNFIRAGFRIPFQIITTHLTIPILLRTSAETRSRASPDRNGKSGGKEDGRKGINGRIAVGTMIIKTENYET